MRSVFCSTVAATCAILSAATASAHDVWNEFNQGDLSSDPNAPTPLVFGLGDNRIIGSVFGTDDARDYITFTIQPGQQLVALLLQQYEDLKSGGEGNTGFHAIIEGDTSFIPDANNIHLFLGAAHLDWAPPGTDILPNLADGGLGAQGFDIPLGPGTYTYHVQQTGPVLTGYTLEFIVVPAPACAGLFGVMALQSPRRRRVA